MEVVRVPRLNANEDELSVAGVHVSEGEAVRAGQLLVSVESTKATSDVEAPIAGYVRRLAVSEGDVVEVGRALCSLTSTLDEPLPEPDGLEAQVGDADVRATKRARVLAAEHGVDLAALGVSGIVKERDIQRHIEAARSVESVPTPQRDPLTGPNPILILGAGGHAKVIIDVIGEGHRELTVVGALDDGTRPPESVLGVPVLGRSGRLAELRARGIGAAALGVGAVTHNATRAKLYARLLEEGFSVPTLIHPRAAVEPSARLGAGDQIFAGAVIGSDAHIGDNVIVNSGVVVSHDCVVGSHVHLTPGAILAGGVTVGEGSVIGMGVTVYLGVTIGRDVVISNGCHILSDVPDGSVVRAHAEPS